MSNVRFIHCLVVAALLVALTACPEVENSKGAQAGFTLRLRPEATEVQVGESLKVQVTIARTGSFAAPVDVGLAADAPGFEAERIQIVASEGELTLFVTEGVPLGAAFVRVRAEAAGIVKEETLRLKIEEARPTVTGIIRTGVDPSLEVRQGAGAIGLLIEGKNLDHVAEFAIEDLETTIEQLSSESVHLTVLVEHGVPTGPKALVLTSEGGATDAYPAVEVTEITASPSGNDVTGAGTKASPYLTLARALADSAAGDTVVLLPGEYAISNAGPPGATGPLVIVPTGVWLRGEATDAVFISGTETHDAIGVALNPDSRLSDLTIRDFNVAVTATSGRVSLTLVNLVGNQTGLLAAAGEVVVEASMLIDNGVGIHVGNDAGLWVNSTEVRRSGRYGLEVGGEAIVHADDLDLIISGYAGVAVGEAATVHLRGGQVAGGARFGLLVDGGGVATLDGVRVALNDGNGIEFQGRALELRNVTVDQNGESGLRVVGTPEQVDLGQLREEGGNRFQSNGTTHISDERAERATLEAPPLVFTVSASTFDGESPKPMVYVGPFNSPAFQILNANNAIHVFD